MKIIPLIKNGYALVDDEDYNKVKNHSWRLNKPSPKSKEYAITTLYYKNKPRRIIKMHRLIMKAKKNQSIDHIDRNGLNNRRNNLRFATAQQNRFNSIGRKTASSFFKGVCWDKAKKKWRTNIMKNNKLIHLGYYHNEIIAAWVYDRFAKKMFREFAFTNFN